MRNTDIGSDNLEKPRTTQLKGVIKLCKVVNGFLYVNSDSRMFSAQRAYMSSI